MGAPHDHVDLAMPAIGKTRLTSLSSRTREPICAPSCPSWNQRLPVVRFFDFFLLLASNVAVVSPMMTLSD